LNQSEIVFELKSCGVNLLTRDQGARVRSRIAEIPFTVESPLVVEFSGVEAITPSFIDELLGRMLVEMGAKRFRDVIRLRGATDTVQRLVNRVLSYRSGPRQRSHL
jgi:hypothetical protein